MMLIIPASEFDLLSDLQDRYQENRYKAPETQNWGLVSLTLEKHLEGRTAPWIEDTLRVWRNEPLKKETPGTEAPGASTENPFPVANCEKRLSEPEALSSSADKLQQKMRPLVLHTINTEGDYERAKGWLRYEALRTMDIRRFTELVNRNVAGENFDEMVDQIIVERKGL